MTERLIDVPDTVHPHVPVVTCACGHEAVGHDRTALRYCLATASGDLRRSCICTIADAQPMSRR